MEKSYLQTIEILIAAYNRKSIACQSLTETKTLHTAYEMLRSLVGSEMCIRDSTKAFLIYNSREADNLTQTETMTDYNTKACKHPLKLSQFIRIF